MNEVIGKVVSVQNAIMHERWILDAVLDPVRPLTLELKIFRAEMTCKLDIEIIVN